MNNFKIKLFHGTTDVLYDKFIKKKGLLPPIDTGWYSIWKDKKVHLRNDVIYLTELFGYAVEYGKRIIDTKKGFHKNIVVLEVEVDIRNLEPEEEKKYHKRMHVKSWDECLFYFHSVQTEVQPRILRVGRIPYSLIIRDKQFLSFVYNYFDRAIIPKNEEEINSDEPTIFERIIAYDMYFASKYCKWDNIKYPLREDNTM